MISERVQKMIQEGLAYPLAKSSKEEKDFIKLCSNENPFGPSPMAIEAIKSEAEKVGEYPESSSIELKEAIGEYLDVNPVHISVGNGSDEVMDMVCKATMNPGDKALIPIPSFSQYELTCRINAMDPNFVYLEDYQWNIESVLEKTRDCRAIFIGRPNNPTGNSIDDEDLEMLLETEKLVIVDEAYGEFSDYTVVDWIEDYENLIVLRTFSKMFGLAGLRVGYGISSKEIIEAMERVRSPFNVNRIAQKAAIAALKDKEFVGRARETILDERNYLQRELESLGFKTLPSDANFIMTSPKPLGMNATDVCNYLNREGILIRNLSGFRGIESDWVRITVGGPKQNKRLIKTLEELIEG